MKRHKEVPSSRPLTRLERCTLREIKRSCGALSREHRETVLLWTFDLADPRSTDSARLQASGVRVLRGWQVPALSPALWCRLVTSDRKDATAAQDFGEVSGRLWRTARAHPVFASTAALPEGVPGGMRCALVALALGLDGAHPVVRSDVISGTPLSGGGLPFTLHGTADAPELSSRRMRLSELLSAEPWWSVTRPWAFDLLRHIAALCLIPTRGPMPRSEPILHGVPTREKRGTGWIFEVSEEHLDPNTVRTAIYRGQLPAEKIDGVWLVDVDAVCRRWPEHRARIQRKLREEGVVLAGA